MDAGNRRKGWLPRLVRGILCFAVAVSMVGQTFFHSVQAAESAPSIAMACSGGVTTGDRGESGDGFPPADPVVDCGAHGCCSVTPAHVEIRWLACERPLLVLEPFPVHAANMSRPERPPRG